MIRLLKIEWLKLKHYTVFKVLSILFLLGIILTNYIVYVANKNLIGKSPAGAIISGFNPYTFPTTWESTTYATGCLLMLPAILIIILITNEYAYRTHRQNIIDGLGRSEFITVKLMLALIIAAVTTIFVILTAVVFGMLSGTDFSWVNFSHVGYFFLKALTYNLFAVLIAVLVKRSGFAIGLCFIYLVAENIISILLDYASGRILDSSGRNLGSMGDYLPLSASDGLLKFPTNPLLNMAKSTMPEEFFWVTLVLAVAYLALFFFWSRKRFIKSDL